MKKRNLLTILLIIMTFGLLLVGCKKKPTTTVKVTTTENDKTQGQETTGGSQTTINREVIVSFNTNGGSDVETQTVVKGERVNKPTDPSKQGYVFLGWYKDNGFTEEFDFDETINETTTVYAYFVLDTEKDNYDVTLVYGNGEENTLLTAYDGKLYRLPAPQKDGYIFMGWYVSLYNDAQKLSYKVTDNTIFNESTSIYAVWTSNVQTDALKAPVVSVDGNSISWNAIEGANQYKVTIYNGDLKVYEKTVATVSDTYDFANLESGDYVVEVVAIAANEAMNSEAGKSYYLNKSLPRVTIYEVNGNVISWNAVEGATSYKVEYACGNDDHNHETFDVEGTSFDTSICTMVEGGLKVRILACKDGYKSSYSDEITVLVKLPEITNLKYDEESDILSWDRVEGANYYKVTVDESTGINVSNLIYWNYMNAGEYNVTIEAVADGSILSSSASITFSKTKKSAESILVTDDKLDLGLGDAVKIVFSINGTSVESTTGILDFESYREENPADEYVIKAKRVYADGSESSFTIEEKYVNKLAISGMEYEDGYVWFDKVAGAKYEIKVNDCESWIVDYPESQVTLEKTGINTISARAIVGDDVSEWTTIEIDAIKITFDMNGGKEIAPIYAKKGDYLFIYIDKREGYDFAGFYLGGTYKENKKLVDLNTASFDNDVTVTAAWKGKKYTVTYVTNAMGSLSTATTEVIYGESYQLALPFANDASFHFAGWFTGENGYGNTMADEFGRGESWSVANDVTLYAFYRSAVDFKLLEDGTYEVVKGNAIDGIEEVVVPATYNGKEVTTINAYAFQDSIYLKSIKLPNTIKYVDTQAFSGCSILASVTVYDAGIVQSDIVYESSEGVLILNNKATSEKQLVFVPYGMDGIVTLPSTIEVIAAGAVLNTNISKIIIPSSVRRIETAAFQANLNLFEIEMDESINGSTILIQSEAFRGSSVKSLFIPAGAVIESLDFIKGCASIEAINVSQNNAEYSSADGVLFNKAQTKLIYYPAAKEGTYAVPSSVTEIADYAFSQHVADSANGVSTSPVKGLTEITINNRIERIGEYAFNNVKSLTKVSFTGLIGSDMIIESYAFRGCTNLTDVDFTNQSKVKEIKSYAFSATGLTSVTIPASVTLIENAAFLGIKATSITFRGSSDAAPLTIGTSTSDGSYAISSAVFSASNVEFMENGLVFEEGCNIQVINSGAFQGLNGLKEVTLPSSLIKVNAAAFYNCPTIEKININTTSDVFVKIKNYSSFYGSNSIKELLMMPDCAFVSIANAFGNQKYENITIAEGNTAYMVTEQGNIYSADGKTLVFANASSITEIGVTDTTTEINSGAYNGNTTIVKLVIGPNVETIASNAFEGCTELVEVEFLSGEKAISLGDAVFKGCTKLTTITFSERVTEVTANMFQGCAALENIDLSTGAIISVGSNAFNGCANLSDVNFGTTVEAIGSSAFFNCGKLENVTLPASVLTVGYIAGQATNNSAFSFNPDSLKSIVVTGENAGLKVLNNTVILSGDGKYIYEALKSTTGEVVIPNTVEVIYSQAFKDCTEITGLVFEKGGVAALEIGASSIGNGTSDVFSGCTGITTLEIPERCTYISIKSFYNCPVATLTFENASKKVSDGALELVIAGGSSSSTVFASGKAINAPKFTDIVLPERLKSASFLFSGNESIETIYLPADATTYGSNLLSGAINLKKVTFGSGSSVTTLPSGMFNGCTNLVTIENMPSTITSFGNGAFTNCASLTSITIPGGIAELASGLFSGCISLKNVTIEEGVQVIASKAFENCKALETVTIPTTVTTLGKKPSRGSTTQNAFAGCTNLKTVIFADIQNSKCAEIALGAFMNCTSLESFEIPPLVTAIRGSVFKGCTSLKTVTYANATKITTIEGAAFDGCTGLISFTFPDSVTSLTANAFANCTSLETVTLPKKLTTWNATAFANCPNIASYSIDPSNTTFSTSDGALLKGSELAVYPAGKTSTEYMIPSSCSSIGANAFENNSYLVSIDYAGTSLSIGNYAFRNTSLLTIFNFTYVASIGNNAFEGSNVDVVMLGNSVTTIGNGAFLNCKNLKVVDLESANSTTLGTDIFKGCTSLLTVLLPKASTKTNTIPSGMFDGCSSLMAIIIPGCFTKMGNNPFIGCPQLVISSNSTSFVYEDSYLYSADKTIIYSYLGTDVAIVIPNDVVTIAPYAFANSGITSLVSGTGLKNIQTGAFSGCSELTTVTLTNVTSLGTSAFADNVKLTTIELGMVSTIGGNCFKNDKLVANLYIKSCVSCISENAFAGWVKGQKVWISSEFEKDDCMDEDGIGQGKLFDADADFDSYQFLFQWGWEEE